MVSQRRHLPVNVNDSKNTRLDVMAAGRLADWRADQLAHVSRYCKIAQLIIDESRRLGRPLDCFEAGCGHVWALRYLYRAIVAPKAKFVRQYIGYDIDPIILQDVWSGEDPQQGWLKLFNGELVIQDLTTRPRFKYSVADDGKFDLFWSTEVIEHMKPKFVEPWIKAAAKLLRPGGLAYISTPNSDGSRDKLPADHVYEWGFDELRELLEKHFTLRSVSGVFTQLNNFKAGQLAAAIAHKKNYPIGDGDRRHYPGGLSFRLPDEIVRLIDERFDNNWQRVVLAMFYPHLANNCAWILEKKS